MRRMGPQLCRCWHRDLCTGFCMGGGRSLPGEETSGWGTGCLLELAGNFLASWGFVCVEKE